MVHPISSHRAVPAAGSGPRPAGGNASRGTVPPGRPAGGPLPGAADTAAQLPPGIRVALSNLEAAGTTMENLSAARAALERVAGMLRRDAESAVGAQTNLDNGVALRLLG